jgi:hypothetical protein
LQRRFEIGECQTDLSLEVRLGRAIPATADLTRHEQEIIGSDRCGIGMCRVEVMPVGGENGITLSHVEFSCHGFLEGSVDGPMPAP